MGLADSKTWKEAMLGAVEMFLFFAGALAGVGVGVAVCIVLIRLAIFSAGALWAP